MWLWVNYYCCCYCVWMARWRFSLFLSRLCFFFSIHTDTTQSLIKYTGHTELNRCRRRRFCFVYVLVRQCICIGIFCGRNFCYLYVSSEFCAMFFVFDFPFFLFSSSLSFFIESRLFSLRTVFCCLIFLTHFSRFTLFFSLVFLRNWTVFWVVVWFGFFFSYVFVIWVSLCC